MNKLIAFLFLSTALPCFAAIHTVDNTAGAGAQFAGIAAAITAAAEGDTILVHPSQVSYGGISVNKSVVLIGPGHLPQYSNLLPATLGMVTMLNGSSGTVIEGFVLSGVDGAVFHVANNITIRNNYFNSSAAVAGNYGDNSGADNWIIEGNVIVDPAVCGGCVLIYQRNSANGNDNWTIRNNIIQSSGASSNVMFSDLTATTTVANNIIIYNTTGNIFINSANAVISNNIFYASSPNTALMTGCTNCLAEYNLFYNPNTSLTDVAGTGNIMNEDPEFVSIQGNSANFIYTNDYHLSPGSPAVGSGGDGVDMGLYAEGYNFRMQGYSNFIPRLTTVTPQYIVVPVDGTFTILFGAAAAGQ